MTHFTVGVAASANVTEEKFGGWYHDFTPCAYKNRVPLDRGEVWDVPCDLSGRYVVLQMWEYRQMQFCELSVYRSKCRGKASILDLWRILPRSVVN